MVPKIKENSKLLVQKLAVEIKNEMGKVCRTKTVSRVLRENGFNGRVARKKTFISKKKTQIRLKTAQDHMTKPISFWEEVIFADELKFNIFRSDAMKRKAN